MPEIDIKDSSRDYRVLHHFSTLLTSIRTVGSHRQGPSEKVEYTNNLRCPIYVSTRDGNRFRMESVAYNSRAAESIIIRHSRTMLKADMMGAIDHLKRTLPVDDPVGNAWIKAYYDANGGSVGGGYVTAVVEYQLDRGLLVPQGEMPSTVYLHPLDLLIEFCTENQVIHPQSPVALQRQTVGQILPNVGDVSAVFMFKAIEHGPERKYEDRYINIGGDTYKIPVENDPVYPEGIHVISRASRDDTCIAHERIVSHHYSFAEADSRFHLSRSVEEAKRKGPVEEVIKRAAKEADLLVAEKKLEEARLRGGHLEAEETIQRVKNEGSLKAVEQVKESASRKNWGEWLKLGINTTVTLVTAAVALFTVYSKLKKA